MLLLTLPILSEGHKTLRNNPFRNDCACFRRRHYGCPEKSKNQSNHLIYRIFHKTTKSLGKALHRPASALFQPVLLLRPQRYDQHAALAAAANGIAGEKKPPFENVSKSGFFELRAKPRRRHQVSAGTSSLLP
ncbi:hypothetical protein [Dechloromonas denitrificans]|uniref:hypothetical protein n=1 Tax=Dechloromonas denitrificans TaxID=281362 RepID=UPI001CF8E6E2|nr:hypothetical protein [Dechloromonas denitrificans]UCV01654.1 hypothetical protein KI611_11000 [Dechloromonas denitrificans]